MRFPEIDPKRDAVNGRVGANGFHRFAMPASHWMPITDWPFIAERRACSEVCSNDYGRDC